MWVLLISSGATTYWLNREYNALEVLRESTIDPLAQKVDTFIDVVTNDLHNPSNWDIGTVIGFIFMILLIMFVFFNLKADNDIRAQ